MTPDLATTVERVTPKAVALRHELHEHPEIRYEEHWTSDRIAAFLDAAQVPYQRGYAKGTGIVATLKGSGERTVALRTDIDALEITEETGLPYASTIPGHMHACGHDGHMACLCGALQVLLAHRDEFPGTVRFLFQPAEELGGGGRLMAEEGAVDGMDGVFGMHGWPNLPVGQIALRPGWFMASADSMHITVTGQGCHGADPAAGVDPVVVAAHIVTALQSVVSRELNPWESAVVTVSVIEAGNATNIIPTTAHMAGTLRAFDPERFDAIRASVRRIAEHTAQAMRATAEVTFSDEPYPALLNHAETTEFVCKVAGEVLGDDAVVELQHPVMVSEDFAYYTQRVPGAFFFLGTNPDPSSSCPALHTPFYNFPDQAVPHGIRLMASLAMRFLTQE
ncbi:MAG: amidohydrolase [bacterium]|nr:amidohydrolase [bacterium]